MDNAVAIGKSLELLMFLADGKEITVRAAAFHLNLSHAEITVIVQALTNQGLLCHNGNRQTVQCNVISLLELGRKAKPAEGWLPKGLDTYTLKIFEDVVAPLPVGWEGTAREIGELVGVSIVTARLYLEYMVTLGVIYRRNSFRKVGRPAVIYGVLGKAGMGASPCADGGKKGNWRLPVSV